MTRLLELLGDTQAQEFKPGTVLIAENQPAGPLYILVEGQVEITREGVEICKISTPGSSFGEMSALLGIRPTATVTVAQPSKLIAIENPLEFLSENSQATLEIAKLLAYRVNWITLNFAHEKAAPKPAEVVLAMSDDSFAKRLFGLDRF